MQLKATSSHFIAVHEIKPKQVMPKIDEYSLFFYFKFVKFNTYSIMLVLLLSLIMHNFAGLLIVVLTWRAGKLRHVRCGVKARSAFWSVARCPAVAGLRRRRAPSGRSASSLCPSYSTCLAERMRPLLRLRIRFRIWFRLTISRQEQERARARRHTCTRKRCQLAALSLRPLAQATRTRSREAAADIHI